MHLTVTILSVAPTPIGPMTHYTLGKVTRCLNNGKTKTLFVSSSLNYISVAKPDTYKKLIECQV